MPADPVSRIAFVKPCCIGDCVMSLPTLANLHRHFPSASIDVWVGPHSADVFRQQLGVRRLTTLPDTVRPGDVPRLARRLNRQRYELVVIPDRSRLLGVAARLGRPGRYLQASGAGKDPFRHEIDVYLDVLEAAGLDILDREPRLEPDDRGRHEAGSILDWTAGAPFAVLQPGGAVNPGTSMLDKRWPWERYAALAAWLQERGYMVLLSGGADDYPLCQQVTGRASLSLDRIIAGQLSLQGMAALLQSAALYVGNDTGMSHVAAAVGVPSVVVFGPTNPRRYGPRGRCVSIVAPPESRFIVTNDLRRAASVALPSTEMVPLEDVVIACEERLTAGRNSETSR